MSDGGGGGGPGPPLLQEAHASGDGRPDAALPPDPATALAAGADMSILVSCVDAALGRGPGGAATVLRAVADAAEAVARDGGADAGARARFTYLCLLLAKAAVCEPNVCDVVHPVDSRLCPARRLNSRACGRH